MPVFDWTPETRTEYEKHRVLYDILTWIVYSIIALSVTVAAWIVGIFATIEIVPNLLVFLIGEPIFVAIFLLSLAMSWIMPVSLTFLAFILGAGLLDNFFFALITGFYVGISSLVSAISRNFVVSNTVFMVVWFLWYRSIAHHGIFVPLHWHDFNPFYLLSHISDPIG